MIRDQPRAAPPIDDATYASLKPRELQFLRMVATGMSAKAIANTLGLSHRTVEQGLFEARGKLGVSRSIVAGQMLVDRERATPPVEIQPATTVAEPLAVPPPPGAKRPHDDLPLPPSTRLRGTVVREARSLFEAPPRPRSAHPEAKVAEPREVRAGLGVRLLIILAWFVGAPLALAVVVLAYLGITTVERMLSAQL